MLNLIQRALGKTAAGLGPGLADGLANGQFTGGLKLEEHKDLCAGKPILTAPVPQRVILPLQQHIGEAAEPLVDFGDEVLKGQLIAKPNGYISAGVHATTSGTVVAIGDFAVPHPSGLKAECILIEADGQDRAAPPLPIINGDISQIDTAELRQMVRDAGIVGLGGAAFPSAAKLNPGPSSQVDTLILNGAECEPYIACDEALMRERADEIIAGIDIIQHIIGAKRCVIGIKDNKTEAIAALRAAIQQAGQSQTTVAPVASLYPAGGEKQLIQAITGKEVPANGLPAQIGIVCHNVATAVAVHRAIRFGEPLLSRLVSVTGHGLQSPQVIEARIGTPVEELIALAGGYKPNVDRLIMGGPMMGFTLRSDAVPIIKSTNSILATLPGDLADLAEDSQAAAMPCIRCGACAEVCPASLLPQQLYWHSRARDLEAAQEHNLFDCIECGCCAQVCPSQIPLVQYYRYAKSEIWESERERRASDIARDRFEFREQRQAREEAEKKAKAERKKAALQAGTDSKQAAIAAALARAKQKREGQADETETATATATANTTSKTAATATTGAAAALAKAKAAANAKTTDPAPAKSAAQLALEKAKAARSKASNDEPASGAAASKQPSAAERALAKAKAASAKSAEGATTKPNDAPAKTAAALALEKAKATRAAANNKASAQAETATESAADIAAENKTPAQLAIEKAKAKKRAGKNLQDSTEAKSSDASPANTPAPAEAAASAQPSVAAQAIAKAKAAAKAAEQSSPATPNNEEDSGNTAAEAADNTPKSTAQLAIERAKAKAKAKARSNNNGQKIGEKTGDIAEGSNDAD